MKNKILLIFILHLVIIACYITVTSWMFVKQDTPNPVGTGLQQSLCVIIHLILTAVACLVIRARAVDKKAATGILWLNLGAVIFWVVINLLLSNIVWSYLWSLRK